MRPDRTISVNNAHAEKRVPLSTHEKKIQQRVNDFMEIVHNFDFKRYEKLTCLKFLHDTNIKIPSYGISGEDFSGKFDQFKNELALAAGQSKKQSNQIEFLSLLRTALARESFGDRCGEYIEKSQQLSTKDLIEWIGNRQKEINPAGIRSRSRSQPVLPLPADTAVTTQTLYPSNTPPVTKPRANPAQPIQSMQQASGIPAPYPQTVLQASALPQPVSQYPVSQPYLLQPIPYPQTHSMHYPNPMGQQQQFSQPYPQQTMAYPQTIGTYFPNSIGQQPQDTELFFRSPNSHIHGNEKMSQASAKLAQQIRKSFSDAQFNREATIKIFKYILVSEGPGSANDWRAPNSHEPFVTFLKLYDQTLERVTPDDRDIWKLSVLITFAATNLAPTEMQQLQRFLLNGISSGQIAEWLERLY